jgi:alpha-L-fucosidase
MRPATAFLGLAWALSCVAGSALAAEGEAKKESPWTDLEIAPGPFKPDWESLKQYQCPEWFRDAKFGIWAHWTAQCVPEDGDWYARGMYEQGSGHYKYHVEHYGHPSKFGFKDICNLWKAEKWDPEKLIQLYKRAGAKYFVALANHHCNFDCWDSKYHEWNSVKVGPHKDIVGTWAEAARRHGLRFGVTVHSARSWDWFDVAHGSDKTGPLAGVPYDGRLTRADGQGQWWQGLDPQNLYCSAVRTPENQRAFVRNWFFRTRDLIDRYHPDLLYFDDSMAPHGEVGLRVFAHFYNASLQWNGGRMEVILNTKGVLRQFLQCLVLDIERGRADRLEGYPWQTDTCIGDWHYRRGIRYASAENVVHQLIDIVSKNGNLLLNIPVRGDGTIDDEEIKILEGIARWMAINSEAIYGTRPWLAYGENARGGRRGGMQLGPRDIRFTSKGEVLYAIALGWPTDGKLVIRSLAKVEGATGQVANVTLLGHEGGLTWTHDEQGLTIRLPGERPCEYAVTFKITGQKLRDFKPEVATRSMAQPIAPDAQGKVTLDAGEAEMHGNQVQTEKRGERENIGFWDRADDWVSWTVRFPKAAAYEVTACCAAQAGASELSLEAAGQTLTGQAPQTKSWEDYKPVSLGKLEIKAAGDQVLRLRPRDAKTWRALNVTTVTLTPQ